MKALCIAAAICCLLICTIPQAFSVAQVIEGLVNLRFQLDARIFAVMAALRAAGFDPDSDPANLNSVRKLVHERLAGINPELRERLRKFREAHDTESDLAQRQSKYVSYALLLDGPPGFRLAYNPDRLPAAVREMQGFESLVEELWLTGELEQVWVAARPFYIRETEEYRPRIRDMIVAVLRYMRTEARVSLDRQVVFIPDMLSAPGVVNARNIGSNYIVVVGPARAGEKPIRSVRHEYLHFLLDPIMAKYVAYLPDEEPFLKRINEQPAALERYRRNFNLMVTESLLQMVEIRLDRMNEEKETAAVIQAYEEGLILAPYFEGALRKFEQRAESMPEAFQALIEGIRWDVETSRSESISRLRNLADAARSQKKAEEAALARSEADVRNLLSSANRHLMAREFDQAREELDRVLSLDADNASALFGMAQVAAQEQALERALDLYEQAAVNAKEETWIAAWSYLRRGNIFRSQEEPDKARAEWSRVLRLSGDLRGAAEAARKALSQPAP